MPLLTDPSTEIFANTSLTCDDSNNNYPCVSLLFHNKNFNETNHEHHIEAELSINNFHDLDQLNHLNNCISQHLDETLVNSDKPAAVSVYDISEFLVFHEKPQVIDGQRLKCDDDQKLKNGCFVPLMKCEIPRTEPQVTKEEKRLTRSAKRLLTIPANAPIPKRAKQSKLDASSHHISKHMTTPCSYSRKTEEKKACKSLKPSRQTDDAKSKTLRDSLSPSLRDHPPLIFKFVRVKEFSNCYRCYYVGRPPNEFGLKDCSVVLERIPVSMNF